MRFVIGAAFAAALAAAPLGPSRAQTTAHAPYASIEWQQPVDGATVHDNDGNVEVVVALAPPLNAAAGHRIGVVLDDGVLPQRWRSTRFIVRGIDRGEHRLRVFVVAADGQQRLAESEPRTVHVYRASRLFPNRNP